jgi:hypothetical protein
MKMKSSYLLRVIKQVTLALVVFLFTSIGCFAQGLVVFTGNVDRMTFTTFEVINPDPSGIPITIPQIGIEYHFMDMKKGTFVPIDMEIYFPLLPDSNGNVSNCIKWFNQVRDRELKLNFNGLPGYWNANISPWPYLQVAFTPGTKQIFVHGLDGHPVWLWDGRDVQCSEVMDWHAPYVGN